MHWDLTVISISVSISVFQFDGERMHNLHLCLFYADVFIAIMVLIVLSFSMLNTPYFSVKNRVIWVVDKSELAQQG